MSNIIKNFLRDEEGATAIEYGLIAGLVAVVIIVGASALGGGLSTMFCKIADIIKNPSTSSTFSAAADCS